MYIVYLNEHEDALDTKKMVEAEGRRCQVQAADVRSVQVGTLGAAVRGGGGGGPGRNDTWTGTDEGKS